MSATFQPDRMPGYVLPKYAYRRPPELAGGGSPVYPAVVVGAGLAGLTAALELGRRGVRTLLLDEDDTVGAQGLSSRGISHAKRSLEIYARFGVAERVRAKGVTWNEGEVFLRGERLFGFDLQPERDQKYPAFVNLQQFYVEQYLVEALQDVGAVDLCWRNRVVDVRAHPDHVALDVETPEGRYALRARYVIAADGARSTLREKLGARDAESTVLESHWCVADVRVPGAHGAVRTTYLDAPQNDGGAVWYERMADGVWRTDWLVSHYEDPVAQADAGRARARLASLLGPDTPFELVWVGPWQFRRRVLERLTHGLVFFLGDASAQHAPFGARGGNRAVQDANNLGWKLALVLQGRAVPALLATYELERLFAAREHVEIASRSAQFVAPETDGQRRVRDAFLELARKHAWARPMVNAGRPSVASTYACSPLNSEAGALRAPASRPGAAAPDGHCDGGYFVDRLGDDFVVAYFGAQGPVVADARIAQVRRKGNEALFERYGVEETATYVFRPDGHVLARCPGIDGGFAHRAVRRVLEYVPPPEIAEGVSEQPAADRLFDLLSAQLDAMPPEHRAAALAPVIARIEARQGNLDGITSL